eukprot:TRINITY_DN15978_c0_g1_i1.p1 TRINITY_DN15978_c0_g1~~TRINITY_DN15978_c0_g1_i1.p1  ORF type:complete len:555 (+),score=80.23 TRINITY_DN15978_c0_g1_i1:107-1771(+)
MHGAHENDRIPRRRRWRRDILTQDATPGSQVHSQSAPIVSPFSQAKRKRRSTDIMLLSTPSPSRASRREEPVQVLSTPRSGGSGCSARRRTRRASAACQPSSSPSQSQSIPASQYKRLRLGFARDPGLPRLCFFASELASIIGLHPYGSALHTLVRCWSRNHRPSLQKWQRATGGIVLPEHAFARHAGPRLRVAVRAAVEENASQSMPREAEQDIRAAVAECGAPVELHEKIAAAALGQARCARGTALEHTGLDAYEDAFQCKVIRRNVDTLRKQFGGSGETCFAVSGRVDGFQQMGRELWIVEHKRRQRKLFPSIPRYEEVQCQAYMALTGAPACRWVQTLGKQLDVRSMQRCDARWRCVEGRLKRMAQLLRKLAAGLACPPAKQLAAIQRMEWEKAPPWPTNPAPTIQEEACAGKSARSEEIVISDSCSAQGSLASVEDSCVCITALTNASSPKAAAPSRSSVLMASSAPRVSLAPTQPDPPTEDDSPTVSQETELALTQEEHTLPESSQDAVAKGGELSPILPTEPDSEDSQTIPADIASVPLVLHVGTLR